MSSIFEGIKVLDLTRVIAGPLCTQLMADSGATVYKIERPGEGDDSRRMGPFLSDGDNGGSSDESTVFLAYNRGKHSITVDLAQPEGAELVRALALRCDIVVENFKAGTLRKYQLDYESLRQERPDLIYCSITGFGQTGPYASLPAYDFILQGMAGPMSTCGQPDGSPGAEPMRTSIAITDVVAGLYANIGIVNALYHRQRTGEGQFIDMALLDAAVALNGHLAVSYLATGVSPKREGNRNPIASPSEVFEIQDGHLIVAAGNNVQFAALCGVLGTSSLVDDERFATNAMRVRHRLELRQMLAGALQEYRRDALLDKLRHAGVPCAPINKMADVFTDPQVQHRELVVNVAHSSGVNIDLVRNPIRFNHTPVIHKAPPALGEHTGQILADELNLNDESLARLRDAKII